MIGKTVTRSICAAGGLFALAALLSVPSLAQKSDYPSGAAIRASQGHHGGTHGYFDPKPGTPDPVANQSKKENIGGGNTGGGTGGARGGSDSGGASAKSSQDTAGGGTQ